MNCPHVLTMEANGSAYLHHGIAGPWVCPWCERDALAAENAKLREALAVLNQALLEVRHAQNCGAEWYTKGDNGLYMQVRMWVDKGFKAIADTRHTVQPSEP